MKRSRWRRVGPPADRRALLIWRRLAASISSPAEPFSSVGAAWESRTQRSRSSPCRSALQRSGGPRVGHDRAAARQDPAASRRVCGAVGGWSVRAGEGSL